MQSDGDAVCGFVRIASETCVKFCASTDPFVTCTRSLFLSKALVIFSAFEARVKLPASAPTTAVQACQLAADRPIARPR